MDSNLRKMYLQLIINADNQNGNLRWYLPLGVDPPPTVPQNRAVGAQFRVQADSPVKNVQLG